MKCSLSPAGEKFELPEPEAYGAELERVESLASAARREGKEIVVAVGVEFVGAVMAAIIADTVDKETGKPGKLAMRVRRCYPDNASPLASFAIHKGCPHAGDWRSGGTAGKRERHRRREKHGRRLYQKDSQGGRNHCRDDSDHPREQREAFVETARQVLKPLVHRLKAVVYGLHQITDPCV